MRKNIWTSLFGAMAALPNLLPLFGIASFGHIGSVSVSQLISGVGIAALGMSAKDRNVTGGTVPQTAEAEKRVQ